MKTILLTLFFAAATLFLGACKHRNKCVCGGAKAPVASPVAANYGYHK